MTDPNPGFKQKVDSVNETTAPVGDQALEPAPRQGTEATPAPTPERKLDASDIRMPVDDALYGKAKPKRIIIRATVTHGPSNGS
jgi:hypothetical protein